MSINHGAPIKMVSCTKSLGSANCATPDGRISVMEKTYPNREIIN